MRRIFKIKAMVFMCLCLVFSMDEVHSANTMTLRVGLYENPPKIFIDRYGKPAGIFIDVLEHIAKAEGWTLQYVQGTWTEGLERLSRGEIDLMPDVAYTSERAKTFLFHKTPVLSSWFQVYARKDSGIHSLLDLRDKRIAVLKNSVQQEAFLRMIESFDLKMTLVTEEDYQRVFEIAASGKADAAIANHFYGTLNARKFGLEDTAVVFNPSALFFAASKTAPEEILAAIERQIRHIKEDPQSIYYSSLKRWTAEEVQYKIPLWLQVSALVVAALLFVSLLGSMILRHQVNARTRELKRINQEMELRIAERTLELSTANERLKELDKLKSMFIASMSHELRTPLNSIIGFTGMTLQGLSGDLNEEQRDNLSRAYQSAKHLLSLITDIIDISKIEAERIDVYIEKVSLRAIINSAADTIMPQLREKGLELVIEAPEDVAMMTDQKRLFQCLLNFMSNAVKFTERGSITINAIQTNGMVEISVRDTGIGIAENDISRLFEAFERLDSHLRVKAGGTGLGLYLTKKIVTNILKGEVSVSSVEGKGSVFTLRVPKELPRIETVDQRII